MNINEVLQEAIKQKENDQFAMDFAVWLYNLKLQVIDENSIEQLLTIYKKETNGKY